MYLSLFYSKFTSFLRKGLCKPIMISLREFRKQGEHSFLCQKGQMAIFVALVFQVLFVLFSMVVNVGLLIHHKINLQNSVDLAAYYGAQKQAEMLNALSHINYQIRQSWKLLSWRLRVAGSAGFLKEIGIGNGSYYGSVNWDRMGYNNTIGNAPPPFTCVAHNDNGWHWTVTDTTSWCYKTNLFIPQVNVTERIASFNAGLVFNVGQLINTAQQAQQQLINKCMRVGVVNWRTAAQYLVAYKMEQAMRKEALYLLAHNLSRDLQQSQGGFLDTKGGGVYEGIYKTLQKNLSRANRLSLDSVRFMNSLSHANCQGAGQGGGGTPPPWLSEINVIPLVLYTQTRFTGTGCQYNLEFLSQSASPYANTSYDNLLKGLVQANDGGLWRPSLGVEKKSMVYGLYRGGSHNPSPYSFLSFWFYHFKGKSLC